MADDEQLSGKRERKSLRGTYISCDLKLRANTDFGSKLFGDFDRLYDSRCIVLKIKSPLVEAACTR